MQTEGKGGFLSVLSLYGKFKKLKKKEFFEISNFLKFYYTFLDQKMIFDFQFDDLQPNTTYTMFYSTNNEDNRDRKKYSGLYNITFTTLIENNEKNIFLREIYLGSIFFLKKIIFIINTNQNFYLVIFFFF